MVTTKHRQRYRYVGVGTYRPQDAANLADRALLGLLSPRGQWAEPLREVPHELRTVAVVIRRRTAVAS